MAMKKIGDVEKIEVLRGAEAQVLNEAFKRTGKYQVSLFDEEEKKRLDDELEAARTKDKE
jgi:hypothetical protein